MAMTEANDVPLLAHPFPVRQWTPQYQEGLKAFLGKRERGHPLHDCS